MLLSNLKYSIVYLRAHWEHQIKLHRKGLEIARNLSVSLTLNSFIANDVKIRLSFRELQ